MKDDANALLLQDRNHTALSAVAVLAAASATAAEFRWMEGSGISSHAVTSLYDLQALSGGPHLDQFTLRVDADGLTRLGTGARKRTIPNLFVKRRS
ncbi:hypothetical protein AB0M41_25980 [Streptomyces sp. NPDC051896]|uniref:hypothetical protein n=1 Tax=Streptomyces sp. NPDC051896 TaxID=3155416 RepID=UPI00343D45A1